jgi:hypothetical protein
LEKDRLIQELQASIKAELQEIEKARIQREQEESLSAKLTDAKQKIQEGLEESLKVKVQELESALKALNEKDGPPMEREQGEEMRIMTDSTREEEKDMVNGGNAGSLSKQMNFQTF